jgi:hypothetical protein
MALVRAVFEDAPKSHLNTFDWQKRAIAIEEIIDPATQECHVIIRVSTIKKLLHGFPVSPTILLRETFEETSSWTSEQCPDFDRKPHFQHQQWDYRSHLILLSFQDDV